MLAVFREGNTSATDGPTEFFLNDDFMLLAEAFQCNLGERKNSIKTIHVVL